jgi:hypothetical protein
VQDPALHVHEDRLGGVSGDVEVEAGVGRPRIVQDDRGEVFLGRPVALEIRDRPDVGRRRDGDGSRPPRLPPLPLRRVVGGSVGSGRGLERGRRDGSGRRGPVTAAPLEKKEQSEKREKRPPVRPAASLMAQRVTP